MSGLNNINNISNAECARCSSVIWRPSVEDLFSKIETLGGVKFLKMSLESNFFCLFLCWRKSKGVFEEILRNFDLSHKVKITENGWGS